MPQPRAPRAQSPALKISPDDVRSRQVIGTLGEDRVFHLQTKGGYNVLASSGRSGTQILGVGPHPAVAKFMAQRQHPQMHLTELCKSAWHQLTQPEIEAMLPEAEAVMEKLSSLP